MLSSSLLNGVIKSKRFAQQEQSFTAVSTDTRTIKKDDLFVPLIGERFNGHDYVNVAAKNGSTASLWQEGQPIPSDLPIDFQLYIVKDTLSALQQMAKAYRIEVNPKVIGITGSNGKTTTKDILASILSVSGKTFKTQGNFNNHIGLPLTILAMPSTCQYLILEMGMSGFGEIELLTKLAEPDLAIVTNIGESHMEQLGSRSGIAKAKMEIKEGLRRNGKVFIDSDEPLLESWNSPEIVRVGFQQADLSVDQVVATSDGYQFVMDGEHFKLSMLGKHNVKNAAYCIAVAKKLGMSSEKIKQGLSNLSLTSMRLERVSGSIGELIVNDAYNASPTSMIAAIEAVKMIPNYTKRIIVLGDMFELGSDEKSLHESVAKVIEAPITHVITIGERAKWITDALKKTQMNVTPTLFHGDTKDEAAKWLPTVVDKDTVVLFKASRGMKLEEVIKDYQNIIEGRND
ncbi:UDP-N-acetylmuramoyl-tripeptide--D-alanyl-D-alanine ligase [Bacillus sp. FJAT-45037]|uniref:UDP-N-acetylmuramoyl-tripeptide--D-alanyl-D- alanine ligase n=1 Tax=Bacillus sp. FJAT-45037 TaxID=2011007 RepID=UPI000C24903A|nr:UDP-N-acetylmuramoyl-tripeptide--D-alanyl-D-alanine ligase [Bacillus sp. FJAT-45037]